MGRAIAKIALSQGTPCEEIHTQEDCDLIDGIVRL
jgi:hypothetical protein